MKNDRSPATVDPRPGDQIHASAADSAVATAVALRRPWSLVPYIQIARPDHWFKNVFMLAGVLLALFYHVEAVAGFSVVTLLLALVATCIVASSNYVINETLDAPTDRDHPVKRHRPVPSGQVLVPLAYAEWIALGALGLWLAWLVNRPFFLTAALLLIMGVIYNIRPMRSKELPYVDVLSESVNNPIRLALGWFVVIPQAVPPLSLLLVFWLVGAFFMASKRFAEYRSIGDAQVAAAYRRSFAWYDENRLLVSMFFYATGAALFLGVFILRYHLELLLAVPLFAGFFSYYMHVALKKDSACQNPEHLYRETGLMVYLVVCVAAFVGLLFVEIPAMYAMFNIEGSRVPALWKF